MSRSCRPDIVISAGFGGGPRVAIFDGRTLASANRTKLVNDFFVFESTLRSGSFPAIADLNNDGRNDLAFGAGPSGGPRILAFDGPNFLLGTQTVLANFFAGDPNDRDGVRLAAFDRDADGFAELVVGNVRGPGRALFYELTAMDDGVELIEEREFADMLNGAFVG